MHDVFGEFRSDFIEETEEHLDALDGILLTFERDPSDQKLIDGLFRILHTIKGSAASVGMESLAAFTHRAEDLVQRFRSGSMRPDETSMGLLFSALDAIRSTIRSAKEGRESEVDLEALGRRFDAACVEAETAVFPMTASEDAAGEGRPGAEDRLSEKEKRAARRAQKRGLTTVLIRGRIDPSETLPGLRAELALARLARTGEVIHVSPPAAFFQSGRFDGRFAVVFAGPAEIHAVREVLDIGLLESLEISEFSDLDSVVSLPETGAAGTKKTADGSLKTGEGNGGPGLKSMMSENSVRVPVRKLDEMVRLTGELAVISAGYRHLETSWKERGASAQMLRELNALNDELRKAANALQSRSLRTRMLPVDQVFGPFARLVRDLAKREGKDIHLSVRGGDTEVDKKIIDVLGDPLTHLIRNAVDHGVEDPKEREALGKPARAAIALSAEQSGNRIVVTVRDDGRGIDIEKVRRKAVEKGFLGAAAAAAMGETELLGVLFEPGFSTADGVSQLSGRGVGLDVVRSIVGGLNGRVQIRTERGKGTSVSVTLPLSLAITGVLVVESGGSRFGIPLAGVVESVKVPEGEIRGRDCASAIAVRDRIIPVIGLTEALDGVSAEPAADAHGMVSLVVISYLNREIGLLVDRILGKQDIVMKPLEENFRSIRGLAGAAILGDGGVVLVTDPFQMIQLHRERSENRMKKEAGAGAAGAAVPPIS